ncbi:hypothetical protein BC830DRAFT_1172404 [Chytriomyces sp. MP71]|nr:hypothetical protein BC830DRAFT_1172404 [Chytriomyces sp. MP71]
MTLPIAPTDPNAWSPSRPPRPAYTGAEEGGFAYPTVIRRWPVIVVDVINAVLARDASDPAVHAEGSKVIARLSALKYELTRMRPASVEAFSSSADLDDESKDAKGDVHQELEQFNAFWKAAIQEHFPRHSFLSASWLFSECMLYARIHAAVNSQPTWRGYDVFLGDKKKGFRDLNDKVLRIAETHQGLMSNLQIHELTQTDFKRHLHDLFLLSLWGNATDLSMFAGLSANEIEAMRAGASGEENILSNHLPEILDYIATSPRFAQVPNARVDFILDNSGFELFSDLLLADFLHQTRRVDLTVFHCKTIPWFVSDTLPTDVEWLLRALEDPASFFSPGGAEEMSPVGVAALQSLAARCRGYLASGAWRVTADPVWCTFWAHHHLKTEAAALFDEWKRESALCIFKGDLNYRKLVYDCKWESTVAFREAIGAVAELPAVVSLRTNKSDPIVGLAEGVEGRLLAEGNKDWRWSGKLAVIEFCKNDS